MSQNLSAVGLFPAETLEQIRIWAGGDKPDLTQIEKPFGLLDDATRRALRNHSGMLQYFCGNSWMDVCGTPLYAGGTTYRAKPAIHDTIPWEHIHERFQWASRDKDGEAWAYENKPERTDLGWQAGNKFVRLSYFAAYQEGTSEWVNSLQKRPA